MAPLLKWKIITAVSIVVTIILCMMTIYTQREYNYVQMVNMRTESDMVVLKQDYEKLYDAYYSYNKKVLKILEGNDNVYWSKDSSSYIVYTHRKYLFGFNKKPSLQNSEHLWAKYEISLAGLPFQTMVDDLGQVDTLKPHQFIMIHQMGMPVEFFLTPKKTSSTGIESIKGIQPFITITN